MLRIFLSALAFASACWIAVACAADDATDSAAPYHVGETVRVVHPAVARDWRGAKTEALVTRIWYPVAAASPEQPREIGAPGAPLFRGHGIAANAPLSDARTKYPLLLLSHGTGGSANSLDWLASALAAHGYIVAGVNHPGNNASEPLTREGFMLWWERATDLSEVLDGLLVDPTLGAHIDRDRIGAVGFSLGGYTVLELAGARTRQQRFLDFCASPAADAICKPPEMARVKDKAPTLATLSPQTLASMARSGDSYRDPRVKAVFAIAPALGEAFDATSFADVSIPLMLVAGTQDSVAPVDTNIHRIASLMPDAKVNMVPGAAHYTFLDDCLPGVVDQLAGLCKDPPGVDREAVHAQTIDWALGFFASTLPAKPL
ncbi:MAG: alpha/beta fold hydrolase [Paraburkholderia sp.]|uniref:alpha/beta hydrolase family protein n=1 Tax=Paraburkholderia sp. TaxID=1926495 RepID=UPI003C687408